MSRLDDLLPDQRAALSLLLGQRLTYAKVAALLGIQERAVHDRAHAALAVLAPREARWVSPEHRESIGDYLLGQQGGVAERLRTRTLLMGSESAGAWARSISAELAPLALAAMPEIPDASPTAQAHESTVGPSSPPGDSAARPRSRTAPGLPSSRLAGALLLAAIAAAVIAAVLLFGGGGGGSTGTAAGGSSGARASGGSTGSTAAAAPKAKEDRRITLTSPDPASKAIGLAEVLSEGSKYAFYLAAEHLAPSKGFFYAVWLYNSPKSYEALSKSPAVGADGRLQGGALLPANAGSYHTMLLTKETSSRPTHPGPVVLNGAFALH